MKVFFAGICLFFSTLFSCQQKGEDFESVSADEFATLIADSDIQRLDVRTDRKSTRLNSSHAT